MRLLYLYQKIVSYIRRRFFRRISLPFGFVFFLVFFTCIRVVDKEKDRKTDFTLTQKLKLTLTWDLKRLI